LEQKWRSTVRKEALAIRKAIQHFKKDIKCLRPGWITIQTDSQTIRDMVKKPMQHDDDEIQAAAFEVNQLSANIEYIPGKDNFMADFLRSDSRMNYRKLLYKFGERLL